MIPFERDEAVELLVGNKLVEGRVADIEQHVGLSGAEDRIHVDVGGSTIVMPPAQLRRL